MRLLLIGIVLLLPTSLLYAAGNAGFPTDAIWLNKSSYTASDVNAGYSIFSSLWLFYPLAVLFVFFSSYLITRLFHRS